MAKVALNFWQDTGVGTGKFLTRHPWVTLITGYYLTPSVEQGGDVGFYWPVPDLPNPEISVPVSGDVQTSNTQITNYTVGFRFGYFWPLTKESGQYVATTMSGQVPACNLDDLQFISTYSGQVPPCALDTQEQFNRFSGDIAQSTHVDYLMFNNYTGLCIPSTYISQDAFCFFSGGFTQPDNDTITNFTWTCSSADYADATDGIRDDEQDTITTIRMTLSTVIYSDATVG